MREYLPGASLSTALFCLSIACGVAAYIIYLRNTTRAMLIPNRWSWLIWTITTVMEVVTFQGVSGNFITTAVFGFSVVACLAVTLAIWTKGRWSAPTLTEVLCLLASAVSLWLIVSVKDAWLAHLIMLAAVPIAFVPTVRSALRNPYSEDTSAWVLWTISDLLALAYVFERMHSWQELPYPAIEALSHGLVWVVVSFRLRRGSSRINRTPSFLISVGIVASLLTLAAALVSIAIAAPNRPEAILALVLFGITVFVLRTVRLRKHETPVHSDRVVLGENHLGKAVFASRAIQPGDWLLDFVGPKLEDDPSHDTEHSMQIGSNRFVGPSGQLDDYANHSCDPNCGVRFVGDAVFLTALRPISPGDEVTWDYSTTAFGRNFQMECNCRTANCRRLITSFEGLPLDVQLRYFSQGIVAPYIVEALGPQWKHEN